MYLQPWVVSSNIPQAIIIGGGPAGISTALRLQKSNISCTIYELRNEPTTLGGAVGIWSNGLRLIHKLGLHDAVLSRGSSRSDITIRSIEGRVLGKHDLVSWARAQTGFGYVRIKRADLLDVFIEEVGKVGIPIHYKKRLISIKDDEGGVTATFADGTTDTADLLLGCDGIHSSVRKLYVDPPQTPEYFGFAGMSAFVPASALSEAVAAQIQGGINATLTPEGMFMAMTCTPEDDEFYWGVSGEVSLPETGDAKDGWEVHGKEEVERVKSNLLGMLANAAGDWGATVKQLAENSSVLGFYPVYKLPLGGVWSRGRCLLLGDAAHAMPPHAGQGVSMALEDAFLLSRLLENPNHSLSEVYEKFDKIRRPRINEVAGLATSNAQMRKKTGPWGLWAKEVGIWMYCSVVWAFGLDKKGLAQKHLVYDIDEVEI